MTKPYFSQIPNFDYISRTPGDNYISDYISVKNIFKRGKLREDIFQDLSFFEKYSIVGDERPDNVAFKLYGDETLDWIILLSNNILNIQTEWPIPQVIFDKLMLEKYGSYDNLYNGIHHYVTEEVRDSIGTVILDGGIEQPNSFSTFEIIDKSTIKSVVTLKNIGTNKKTYVTVTTPLSNLSLNGEIIIEGTTNTEYNKKFRISDFVTPLGSRPTYLELLPLNSSAVVGDVYITTLPDNQLWIFSGTDWVNLGPAYYEGNKIISSFIVETKDEDFDESLTEGGSDKTTITCDQTIFTCDLEDKQFEFILEPIELGNSPILNRINSTNYLRFFDSGRNQEVQIPQSDYLIPVTNYEYEKEIDDKKRNIFILKGTYLNIIYNDMEELMEYKKGGTQYISPTLKKGDNIRLFS